MPEILTESFCERCGTRYTFESAAPRERKLGRFKVLSRGLKNYVMSDDTSLDEAFAAARNDVERQAVAQQLDAFHKTFNFCMNCRQYTCGNCWNEADGRCLTCAPQVGRDLLPAFADSETNGAGTDDAPHLEHLAWPTADIPAESPAPTAWPITPEATGSGVAESASRDAGGRTGPSAWPEPTEDGLEASAEFLGGADGLARVGDWAAGTAHTVEETAALAATAPEANATAPEANAPDATAPEPPEPPAGLDLAPPTNDLPTRESPAPESATVVPSVEGARTAGATEAAEFVGEPEHALAAEDAESQPETVEEQAAAAVARTSDLLARFRPGQSLDEAIAEYEATLLPASETPVEIAPVPAEVFAQMPQPEAEPEEADGPPAGVETEPAAAVEPERTAMAPEPAAAVEPERRTVEPEPTAVAETKSLAEPASVGEPDSLVEPVHQTGPEAPPEDVESLAASHEPAATESTTPTPAPAEQPTSPQPEPVSAAEPPATSNNAPPRADDRIEVPVWRIVAPDAPAATPPNVEPGRPAHTPAPTAASARPTPEWPPTPTWPGQDSQVDVSFLAARLSRTPANDALWAASTRDVVAPLPQQPAPPAVQTCVSCGLSLSATARFCRRCGTRQGG